MTSQLPVWAQWVWGSVSFIALFGGVLWTVFFVLPYMRRMERTTVRLLELSIEARTKSDEANARLQDALKAAADGIDRLATAQKIGMGVQVAANLLPTVLQEILGSKKRASSSLD